MKKQLQSATSWFARFIPRKRFYRLVLAVFLLLILINMFLAHQRQRFDLLEKEKTHEMERDFSKKTLYQRLQAGMGDSYANEMQPKLIRLFALPKGLFTPQQITQILGVKLTAADGAYYYDGEEIHIELNDYYFGFSWLLVGNELTGFPIGNCVNYDAFVMLLERAGWKKVWPLRKGSLITSNGWEKRYEEFYNDSNPRRWMLIDVADAVNCIEHFFVYDTKTGERPEIDRDNPPPPEPFRVRQPAQPVYDSRGVD